MEYMEFLLSVDSLYCLIAGAILGVVAGQLIKGLGMVGNIVVGIIGGLLGGVVFNALDVLNVGDVADPLIAGAIGAIVLLAIVGVVKR
ncbi:MAG: GlsB/YeaQ/YmgE family stress response membrane protein [Caldilineaceae bacterium]|nr:GlsB/YeaQ/YmgE family stress response membrane protein [Caldilineaceae bacterium]MCB0096879.1 GlsB/YeaQ/YmgE family stress response membrane protein [Caldilineaceae bacterium]MCB9150857.1 GlsB/YeaQ/YmgE family stress response membrane protein [Caldilineaceae bacterium]